MIYTKNNNAITIFVDGVPNRIEKSDTRFEKIKAVFQLPRDEQDDVVTSILAGGGVRLISDEVMDEIGFYFGEDSTIEDPIIFDDEGEKLPKPITDKLISLYEEEFDILNLANFWRRVKENPSNRSIEQLMGFLAYKELPITTDGHIIAYKGVGNDGFSVHGNLNTKVLKGLVDGGGRIRNDVGDVIEVRRNAVDDDPNVHCSHGLHAGSHAYASNWGVRLLTVKIDPVDVVSVPTDHQCQKVRVCKYEVLSIQEAKEELETPLTDESGVPCTPEISSELGDWLSFVDVVEDVVDDSFSIVMECWNRNHHDATPTSISIAEVVADVTEVYNDDPTKDLITVPEDLVKFAIQELEYIITSDGKRVLF